MAKDKQYTGADILSLSDREHVRLRTQVYLGSMHPTAYQIPILTEDRLQIQDVEFIPAVYKAIGEVIDNSLDEFSHLTSKVKLLKIDAKPETGWFSVSDNGRGIPVDKHATGKFTPEVALGSLKAGRNFTDDKEIGVIGMNGVGAACTNYCSSEFDVTIHRDGKKYYQRFVDGANKVSKPKIAQGGKTTGTQVTFQLDPLVFKQVGLPNELIRNRAIEIAMTNPDVTVEYNGERYRYKKGLVELVSQIAADKTFYCFEINEPTIVGEFFIIVDAHDGIDEQFYTWVNSSLLFDGGKCNTQFMNVLYDRVMQHLEKDAKRAKAQITRNDIRRGLLILANIKIKNPEYDSQAKTRLTGPDLRKEITLMVDNQWKIFAKRVSNWLDEVLEYANNRHHTQADAQATEEHKKNLRKKIPGLLDATNKDRSTCQLLITEGESAKSQICEARDPATTAAFALTGKINNVYGATTAQILKMGKLTELLSAIGLIPGVKALRSELNFGRIVIATDSDYDGSDIFTLLINLFSRWSELFDKKYPPAVFRLVAPNVVASKNGKRVHFTTRKDYEKVKEKYKGWTIEYMKGLGSLSREDWEMVLKDDSCLIPIVDDGKIGGVLNLLFNDNADLRKQWLSAPPS